MQMTVRNVGEQVQTVGEKMTIGFREDRVVVVDIVNAF